ncbi:histidine phosphatase family protein [Galbitalea sp. SE-J8]|uniref:histidine phosphatase family protein n=1 Tax=Galbitalea sp. SE-J8 TaxID=3054952 RepID=UPI00259C9DAF|nr:histidine phosphatase family protein [Galbitalea sp. SE-J8]MDM4762391.1 histidine phosphatase family protein [Galbitalea sp. SE-J8]
MPASRLHLVRHGEVDNPTRVLYGRIPGFHLSALGREMARSAADAFAGEPITRLYASPLERAQESAAPWAAMTGLPIRTEPRIIEPHNDFEGTRVRFPEVLKTPANWWRVRNPLRPSWGEAYTSIVTRMEAAMRAAWDEADDGEVAMVSHQLPIWIVALHAQGRPLFHDARKRRCSLSSVTSFELRDGRFREVGYRDPAADLLARSIDLGAV